MGILYLWYIARSVFLTSEWKYSIDVINWIYVYFVSVGSGMIVLLYDCLLYMIGLAASYEFNWMYFMHLSFIFFPFLSTLSEISVI